MVFSLLIYDSRTFSMCCFATGGTAINLCCQIISWLDLDMSEIYQRHLSDQWTPAPSNTINYEVEQSIKCNILPEKQQIAINTVKVRLRLTPLHIKRVVPRAGEVSYHWPSGPRHICQHLNGGRRVALVLTRESFYPDIVLSVWTCKNNNLS